MLYRLYFLTCLAFIEEKKEIVVDVDFYWNHMCRNFIFLPLYTYIEKGGGMNFSKKKEDKYKKNKVYNTKNTAKRIVTNWIHWDTN